MLDGTHNTKLNTLLSTGKSGKESTFVVIIERTTQSITHFIGESGNTGHPIRIHLHSQRVLRHLRSLSRPSFTINNDTRINRRSSLADFIHCCNIMNSHQVKAEPIKMVFVKPMQYRLYHIFPHHRTVTCRFITTGRPISETTVRHLTIEIPRYCTFKITFSSVKCMIIHYIQHHPDAGLM